MIRITNAVGAEKILPLTMSFRRVPLEISVPSQPLYGLDGDVVTGRPTLRPRQFVLESGIYHRDKHKIEQDLDDLLTFLMHAPVDVYRQHWHNRFLRAHPLGAPQDWLDAGAELALRIPMIALDPYWYGDKETVPISGTGTIYTYGTAPVYPIITTTGSAVNLEVTHGKTGKTIEVTGSGVIEVDCADLKVTIDGVNSLDKINDEFKLNLWELLPGENVITTSHPIEVKFRHRYY